MIGDICVNVSVHKSVIVFFFAGFICKLSNLHHGGYSDTVHRLRILKIFDFNYIDDKLIYE